MSRTLLFSLLFFIAQISFGQKFPSRIDTLNSKAAIEKLIHSFGKHYIGFTLKPITESIDAFGNNEPCKKYADSLNITNSFYKADFDNNGYTDLLAIGDYEDFRIFVVMNYGDDSLKITPLTRRSFQECTFPKIIHDSIIRYYSQEHDYRNKEESTTLKYKDLVFKFGDFVEYNPLPKNYSIEKIEYQTTFCFGSCPKFYIAIDKNKSAIFKAEGYNQDLKKPEEIKGTFNTNLKDNSFLEITGLLNYIDFPNLKDNYEVNWTDDQTCTLTITYNNGQIKKINDYGLLGSFGLNRLYQLLFDLRFNQNWK